MIYTAVIAMYVLLLFGVAISKSRRIKTQEDFMVAGRHVPVMMLVGTLVCTWIGSGSLFGGAGLAFRMGFSQLWMSAGAWVGIVVVYFLAHRVRRIAEFTVPDILEKRYNKWARLFGTFAVIIAYVSIAGYQFRGGGRLLNIITSGGITPETGALITCGVIILFTLLAGMVSIVSIDVFNGIVMIVSVVLAVPFALNAAGGWGGVAEAIPADHFHVFGSRNWIWAVGVFFPTFFLLLGESSIYQKFFSAESERAARRAVIGMIIGVVAIETLLCAVSVIGSGIHWTSPGFVDAAATAAAGGAIVHDAPTTETIILQVAFENLPVIMGALLLSGGVAIILSTGNTFLMVPATNLTRDIYQRFIKPDAGDRTIILFQRVSIAVLGIVALLLATQFTTILAMAFTAYTMVGAGITPALLAAFLWRRTTTAGGVSSIVAGISVTVFITIINWFHQRSHGEPFLETDYIIIPAATASLLALVIVSLLTAKPPREKWEPFYSTPEQPAAT